eukprot:Nk52_evm1s511 gene=Nk52_evmTU1s511
MNKLLIFLSIFFTLVLLFLLDSSTAAPTPTPLLWPRVYGRGIYHRRPYWPRTRYFPRSWRRALLLRGALGYPDSWYYGYNPQGYLTRSYYYNNAGYPYYRGGYGYYPYGGGGGVADVVGDVVDPMGDPDMDGVPNIYDHANYAYGFQDDGDERKSGGRVNGDNANDDDDDSFGDDEKAYAYDDDDDDYDTEYSTSYDKEDDDNAMDDNDDDNAMDDNDDDFDNEYVVPR